MADVQHPEAFWTNSPAGRINLQDSGTSPKALIDRGAVEGNSRGSRSARVSTAERSKEIAVGRGGECNEHTRPAVPPPTSVRPRSGRIVSP